MDQYELEDIEAEATLFEGPTRTISLPDIPTESSDAEALSLQHLVWRTHSWPSTHVQGRSPNDLTPYLAQLASSLVSNIRIEPRYASVNPLTRATTHTAATSNSMRPQPTRSRSVSAVDGNSLYSPFMSATTDVALAGVGSAFGGGPIAPNQEWLEGLSDSRRRIFEWQAQASSPMNLNFP